MEKPNELSQKKMQKFTDDVSDFIKLMDQELKKNREEANFRYPKDSEVILIQRRVLELKALQDDHADPARIFKAMSNLFFVMPRRNEIITPIAKTFCNAGMHKTLKNLDLKDVQELKEIATLAKEEKQNTDKNELFDKIIQIRGTGITYSHFSHEDTGFLVSLLKTKGNQLIAEKIGGKLKIDLAGKLENLLKTHKDLFKSQSKSYEQKFAEQSKINQNPKDSITDLIDSVFIKYNANKNFSSALASLRGNHYEHDDKKINLVIIGLIQHIENLQKEKKFEPKHIVPIVSILAHCMPRWTYLLNKNDNDTLYEKNLNLLCSDVQMNNVEPCHQKIFMDLLQFASFAQYAKNNLQNNLCKLINTLVDEFNYKKINFFDKKNSWTLPQTSFNPEKMSNFSPNERNYVLQAELFKLIYAHRGIEKPKGSSETIKDPFEKLICMVYERQDFHALFNQLKTVENLTENEIDKKDHHLQQDFNTVFNQLKTVENLTENKMDRLLYNPHVAKAKYGSDVDKWDDDSLKDECFGQIYANLINPKPVILEEKPILDENNQNNYNLSSNK